MLARIANMKIDPEELLAKANTSGLVIYLFGDDLKGKMLHHLIPLLMPTQAPFEASLAHTEYNISQNTPVRSPIRVKNIDTSAATYDND